MQDRPAHTLWQTVVHWPLHHRGLVSVREDKHGNYGPPGFSSRPLQNHFNPRLFSTSRFQTCFLVGKITFLHKGISGCIFAHLETSVAPDNMIFLCEKKYVFIEERRVDEEKNVKQTLLTIALNGLFFFSSSFFTLFVYACVLRECV